jgi:hypothetical protein
MRAFDEGVRRDVKALVEAGARLRVLDGCHAILYGPKSTIKVSASRRPEDTRHYLRKQFAAPNGYEGVLS